MQERLYNVVSIMSSPSICNIKVFISYSHDSNQHKHRILALSDSLCADGIDCTIDQYETSPHEGWARWCNRMIEEANYVLVACTQIYEQRFKGTDTTKIGKGAKWEGAIITQELYEAQGRNVKFIPIIFTTEDKTYIPSILGGVTFYEVNTDEGYKFLCRHLTSQPAIPKPELGKLKSMPPLARKQDISSGYGGPQGNSHDGKDIDFIHLGPEKISLARLPSTSSELFGRDKELKILDEAWENPNTNIVSLIAWGGVGKTALINVWLSQIRNEQYRGAERVLGWSFYSQGASEKKQVSTDLFIASALEWFGDPDPNKGTPWEKGERLADLIKKKRTLLILDGLEPLQNPPGERQGQIRDSALKCLLRELANNNSGLCIITTRLEVDDIKDFAGKTVQNIHLDHLSSEAGAQFLGYLGAKGTFDELKNASIEFGGHALALSLLGRYIAIVYQGDIRQRDKIARLTDEQKQGGHARRVIESYEKWFEGTPELNILRIMGLFDRSADGGAIKALKSDPPIEGLTSELGELSDEKWHYALNNLRKARLLAKEEHHKPDTLDCHPLIREHFGEKVKVSNSAAWKEAHSRLYEFYKSQAKEYPNTMEEMIPLLIAVTHGCEADRHQEVLDEVLWRRVHRSNEHFILSKLGAFSANLAALSGFFHLPWIIPVEELSENAKDHVLGEVGYCLQAAGRIAEAVQPIQVALESRIAHKDLENASRNANNLSDVYSIIGNLEQALYYAEKSVRLADDSGNKSLSIVQLTTLANTLKSKGCMDDAMAAFRKAELMQRKIDRKTPFLYSLQGFQYCDLLLNQKKYQAVLTRAGQAIKVAKQNNWPLMIALDHLSLGKAYLLQAQVEKTHDFRKATDHLNQAMEGLREWESQEYIPLGLLARAELYRVRGDFNLANDDLHEIMNIAERCNMGIYQADCHLEYARFYLSMGEKGKARERLDTAKKMIEKMGYHLRDNDVTEIEGRL